MTLLRSRGQTATPCEHSHRRTSQLVHLQYGQGDEVLLTIVDVELELSSADPDDGLVAHDLDGCHLLRLPVDFPFQLQLALEHLRPPDIRGFASVRGSRTCVRCEPTLHRSYGGLHSCPSC